MLNTEKLLTGLSSLDKGMVILTEEALYTLSGSDFECFLQAYKEKQKTVKFARSVKQTIERLKAKHNL